MKDPIERQDAIDAIDEHLSYVLQKYRERYGAHESEFVDGYKKAHEHIKEVLSIKVPSVQPNREYIGQIKWERDTAIQQLKELGYGFGEKMRTDVDTISRQAALDAFKVCVTIGRGNGKSVAFKLVNDYADIVRKRIEALPSAQPEVVRCKDCKHRDPEDKKCDCGHDIQWQLPRQDDWYCADAKRRTE